MHASISTARRHQRASQSSAQSTINREATAKNRSPWVEQSHRYGWFVDDTPIGDAAGAPDQLDTEPSQAAVGSNAPEHKQHRLVRLIVWLALATGSLWLILLAAGTRHAAFVYLALIPYFLIFMYPLMAFMFRMQRDTNGMPPPRYAHRFVPRRGPTVAIDRATIVAARVVMNIRNGWPTTLKIDESQLALVPPLRIRWAYPVYVVPRSEIASVTGSPIEGGRLELHLADGATVTLIRWIGPPLEMVLSGELSIPEAASKFAEAAKPAHLVSSDDAKRRRWFVFVLLGVVAGVGAALAGTQEWAALAGLVIGTGTGLAYAWRVLGHLPGREATAKPSLGAGIVGSLHLLVVAAITFCAALLVRSGPAQVIGAALMTWTLMLLMLFLTFVARIRQPGVASAEGHS